MEREYPRNRRSASHKFDAANRTIDQDYDMGEDRDWRLACEKADDAFQARMRKLGIARRVHTEPQTSRPRTIAAPVVLRSASRWLLPAGDPLVG